MLLICDWLTFRFDFQTGIKKKGPVCEKNTRGAPNFSWRV